MANSGIYEAKLKARRWVEPIVLGLADITPLARDMRFVIQTLDETSKELERLKKSNAALLNRRQPVNPAVAKDPRKLALQIAEKVADGPLAVYRGAKGGIAWCAPSADCSGELVGIYDAGANWQDIYEDLAA